MTTIGDVLLVLCSLGLFAFCGWAATLCASLLFRSQTEIAKQTIEKEPTRNLVLGLITGTLFIAASVVLLNLPAPIFKFLGVALIMAQIMIGVLGCAGLSKLVAERLHPLAPNHSELAALGRGSALVIAVVTMPFIGWMLMLPILHAICLSAGLKSLRKPKQSPVAVPPVGAGS